MDNRKLWSIAKLFFSDKSKMVKFILSDNDKIIKDKIKVAKTLNDYFTNLTKTLKLNNFL